MFNPDRLLYILSFALIPGIFAITVHEVAHGWAARRLGDPTAYMLGRLTLNPFKHIDPIGTVIVPLALVWLAGFPFGWAKPVPVADKNFKNPTRDMVFVAAAGPAANFLMATIWAVIALVVLRMGGYSGLGAQWLANMCNFGMQFNVILAIFNLLPIPPLDGGRVLAGLLPRSGANFLERIEPFGLMIVLLLLIPIAGGEGIIWRVLDRPVRYFYDFFATSIAGFA